MVPAASLPPMSWVRFPYTVGSLGKIKPPNNPHPSDDQINCRLQTDCSVSSQRRSSRTQAAMKTFLLPERPERSHSSNVRSEPQSRTWFRSEGAFIQQDTYNFREEVYSMVMVMVGVWVMRVDYTDGLCCVVLCSRIMLFKHLKYLVMAPFLSVGLMRSRNLP